MSDPVNLSEEELEKFMDEQRQALLEADDPIAMIENVYLLWWHWADFHLYIVSPAIEKVSPPIVIPPKQLPDSEDIEFVYTIHDHGYKLSTSKSEEMFSAGMSMCKLFYTIEK
jgi:hypothetical protein